MLLVANFIAFWIRVVSVVNDQTKLLPFLKWAGGKRWFVEKHRNLIPASFNVYIEPFLGAGAMFFALSPKTAILSDLNPDLINLYRVVRDQPSKLQNAISRYQKKHSEEFYYEERGKCYRSNLKRGAQMLYLNRTCFNGLYRVNLSGKFNVPIGSKTNVVMETDNFFSASEALGSKVELQCSDFEIVIDRAEQGDFLFVDPPYTVKHNYNNFLKYNDQIFSWDDQLRLANALRRASSRDVKILALNAHHEAVIDLYKDLGETHTVSRSSVIAGKSNARGNYEELAVTIGYMPNFECHKDV